LHSFGDAGGVVVAGLGVEVGGEEAVEDSHGGAAVEEAVVTGVGTVVFVGFVGDLFGDVGVDGFVEVVDFGLGEGWDFGGGGLGEG
jgi:hypothetical protein